MHNSCGLCRIDIKNLSVRDGREVILDNVNMSLACGELTAIIGRNGAGKTTLIKAIIGERSHSGQVTYLRHDGTEAVKPAIGYVPQRLSFDRSTPVSVMDFAAAAVGAGRPVWLGHSQAAKRAALDILERMECGALLDKRLGDLSGGELQRLLLAVAAADSPDLLILDEPVSGIDAAGLDTFYKMVGELRATGHMPILLVSHDLELIQKYADEVALIERTVIASGSPNDVFNGVEFKRTFGSRVI